MVAFFHELYAVAYHAALLSVAARLEFACVHDGPSSNPSSKPLTSVCPTRPEATLYFSARFQCSTTHLIVANVAKVYTF